MRQYHVMDDHRRLASLPLPHGCNVLSGKRCRLADGSMHPLVDSTSAARQKGVFATVTARKDKNAEEEEAASVAGEDITDDEAASLVVDWDAHHRQVEVAWEPSSNRTDWVALLASKGHPPSLKCKLPPASQAMPSTSPLVVLRSPRPSLRIAWFFVLGFAPTKAYEEMLKSVVLSGRVHAPSLEPYFLYIMSKEQHSLYVSNGGPSKDGLASWMLSLGVRVVGHVVSFAHKKGFNKEKAQGAQWARLDLFKMAAKMTPEFKQRGLMTSHVLYTDMDLFFSHDPPLPGTGALKACGKPWVPHDQQYDSSGRKVKAATWSKCLRPKEHGKVVADPNWPYIFGAGTEVFTPWGMNSGVMYINVPNSTKYAEPLIDFAAAKGFKSFSTADQQALEHFFGQNNFGGDGSTAWDWLDDSTVNSRGFLPPSEYLDHSKLNPVTKEPFSRAAVWHWHGYKANEIRCFFDRIASGAWDVTKGTDKGPAQDQVPGCHVVKGSGVFPHALKGCYLVTYAWMLTQHETLQQIARTMRVKQEGEW